VEAGWAGRRPRPSGEGGRRLGLGEGDGPREEEGEWAGKEGEVGPREGRWGVGRPKAKVQAAGGLGLKPQMNSKLRKRFSRFKKDFRKILVEELIGKNSKKFLENCRDFRKARK
jgi:hypothetical protein